jgi:hypothetical protein
MLVGYVSGSLCVRVPRDVMSIDSLSLEIHLNLTRLTANVLPSRIAVFLFPLSAPTDVTSVPLHETPLSPAEVNRCLNTWECATRSHRINLDSRRLRSGPVNEIILDITPLLFTFQNRVSLPLLSLRYQHTTQVVYVTSYVSVCMTFLPDLESGVKCIRNAEHSKCGSR